MANISRSYLVSDEVLARIAEIGRLVNSTVSVDEVLTEFAQLASVLVPNDQIWISTLNSERTASITRFVSGIEFENGYVGREIPISDRVQRTDQAFLSVYRDQRSLILSGDSYQKYSASHGVESAAYSSGIRSAMFVPLVWQGESIGGVGFRSSDANVFTDSILEIASQIADQIAGALAISIAYDRLEATEKESRALAELAVQIAKCESANSMYQAVDAMLLDFFEYDRISFVTLDKGRKIATQAYQRGVMVPDLDVGDEIELNQTFHEFESWANELIGSDETSPMVADSPLVTHKKLGLISRVRAPMTTKTGYIGVIALNHRDSHMYTVADRSFLRRIAAQVAPAIEKALLHQQVTEQARELQRRTNELELISKIVELISSVRDRGELANRLTPLFEQVIPSDAWDVRLVDNERKVINVGMTSRVTDWYGADLVMQLPLSGTLTEEVVAARQQRVLSPSDTNEPFTNYPGSRFIPKSSLLSTPLIDADEAIGSLNFNRADGREFTSDEIGNAQTIADQIASAIAGRMLYEQTAELTSELRTFSDISNAISAVEDADELGDELGRLLARLVDGGTFGVFVPNADLKTCRRVMSGGPANRWRFDIGETIIFEGTLLSHAYQTGELIHIPEEEIHTIPDRFPNGKDRVTPVVVLPMIYSGATVAVLSVMKEPGGKFSDTEIRRIGDLANHVAGAVSSRILRGEVERKAERERFVARVGRSLAEQHSITDMGRTLSDAFAGVAPHNFLFLTEIFAEERRIRTRYRRSYNARGKIVHDDAPNFSKSSEGLAVDRVVTTGQSNYLRFDQLENVVEEFPNLSPASIGIPLSFFTVPLYDQGALIGALQLNSLELDEMDQELIETVESISGHLAAVFATLLIKERTERSLLERDVLVNIGKEITRANTPTDIGQKLVEQLRMVTGFDAVQAISIDQDSMVSDVWAQSGQGGGTDFVRKLGEGLPEFVNSILTTPSSRVIEREQLTANRDGDPDAPWAHAILADSEIEALLVCPLLIGGGVVGALLLGYDEARSIEPGLMTFMDEVGTIISAAVEN